jgi:hypothetical protein
MPVRGCSRSAWGSRGAPPSRGGFTTTGRGRQFGAAIGVGLFRSCDRATRSSTLNANTLARPLGAESSFAERSSFASMPRVVGAPTPRRSGGPPRSNRGQRSPARSGFGSKRSRVVCARLPGRPCKRRPGPAFPGRSSSRSPCRGRRTSCTFGIWRADASSTFQRPSTQARPSSFRPKGRAASFSRCHLPLPPNTIESWSTSSAIRRGR